MEDAHLAIDNFGGLAQQGIVAVSKLSEIQAVSIEQSWVENTAVVGLFSVFDGHGGQQIVNFLEENFASVMETNLANFKKPKPKYVPDACGAWKAPLSPRVIFSVLPTDGFRDVMEAIIKTFTEVDQKSSHIDVSGSTVACCLVRQTGMGSS